MAAGTAAGAGAAWAQDAELSAGLQERICELLRERAAAVVRVEATDRHGKLVGTGFFTDPAGTILTVFSVVGDAQEVTVEAAGERLPAAVLLADARSGIALLKVDTASAFLPLAPRGTLALGTPVVALGFPHDLPLSPSFGIVAGFDRKFRGKYFVTTHIRAHVPVQPGFGGAPLLTLRGEVAGIVVAGVDSGAACYVLPMEAAEKIRRDYVRFGRARHGWVGVTVEGFPGQEVRVAELKPDAPAAQAGLRPGDVILQVGSMPIREVEDVLDASFFLTESEPVSVRVRRGGQELFFSMSAAAHPSSCRDESLHTALAPAAFSLQP